MDISDLEKKLGIDGMSADEQMAMVIALQKSAEEKSKQARDQTIGKSAELVIQGLKKIKSDIETRFSELNTTIQSKVTSLQDGKDGRDGKDGKDGLEGKQGLQGRNGKDGRDGRDGVDGTDGVSVTSARIDFDGSLIIGLSSGVELNVGEVVAPDLAERIKVITNGGGTSQSVLDTLASLQTQITNLIPSQTGNSGKYLTTNGTSTSWATITGSLSYQGTWDASTNTPTLASSTGTKNYYYVVATAGSTNLNGITDWQIGDWLLFNGSVWQKIDTTDQVTSVAGRTGVVTLSNTDISGLGTIATQASSNVSITGGSITGITDLAVADGGTGSSTAQGAINALAGAVTSGSYLRGNGTNVVMNTIQAADVPTLNQNTTGTASNVTGTVAIANGGTGSSTASGARTNLGLAIGTDVLAPTGSAASLTSFPTFNQNTTGTASNVTGTVAVANGGTGQTTQTSAYDALNPNTTLGDIAYRNSSSNVRLAGNTTATKKFLAQTGTGTVSAAPTWATIATGDVPTLNQDTTGSAGSLVTTNFSIVQSGTKLLFKYGATTIASMDSTGIITSATNIIANGTP
jgi:hypothetical protein